MKLVSWNVNSLNVRLQHVLDFLRDNQPDVLCLQELKLETAKFPLAQIQEAGYQAVFDGQKTYNGVAIISKSTAMNVSFGIPNYADEQKRVIAATIDGTRVICVYIPNGQDVTSDKYQYKLQWLAALQPYIRDQLAAHQHFALLGDYNIAPADADVHDPAAWAGQVLCTAPERAAFQALEALGLRDSFRLFPQAEKSFSWWDYRMMGFRRNLGMRIDHILLSPALAEKCVAASIDKAPRKLERPSDHAPVVAEINI
jgi:exodeoxyribonuclease III